MAGAQWGLAAWLLGIPFGVQMAENLDRRLPAAARAIRELVLSRASFVAPVRTVRPAWRPAGALAAMSVWSPTTSPAGRSPSDLPQGRLQSAMRGVSLTKKGSIPWSRPCGDLDPAELLVVGDGPLRQWLESADLGTARLRLVRGTDHAAMAELYARWTCWCCRPGRHPTWAEQFGRVLVEAMWCGTPVVGSDSGEIPWVIETTGGGEIFPEGDVEALADTPRPSPRPTQSGLGSWPERGREEGGRLSSASKRSQTDSKRRCGNPGACFRGHGVSPGSHSSPMGYMTGAAWSGRALS